MFVMVIFAVETCNSMFGRDKKISFFSFPKKVGGSTEEILRAVNDRDGWRNKCREDVEGWPQP